MNPEEKQVTALVAVEGEELPAGKGSEQKDGYWARVASRYTVVWRVLLVALLLFAVLFMLLFSRAFTYDSVLCFFKDIQTVSAFIPSDYDTVSATFEEGKHTALSYRGGVAFVNAGGIEVYSPDGRRLLDVSRDFATPRAVASRKYLVAYDGGGKTFSVTNSYAELFRGETEFPIYGAEASDSGHFALITGSDAVLSQILLYDNNFNLIQRFGRASATVGISLSDNGKRIAIVGVSASEGTVRTVLDVYRLGESNPQISLAFEGEIPLSVDFTNNKNIFVLTDKALRCYEINGDISAELFSDGEPVAYTVNNDGAALVLETDKIAATHRVVVFDKKGEQVYDGEFDRDVTAISLYEEEIYLLAGTDVVCIDARNQKQSVIAVESGATDLFAVDAGQIRVVYPAKAVYLQFK